LNALVIAEQQVTAQEVRSVFEKRLSTTIIETPLIQEAIEILEHDQKPFDLIFCDYSGGSKVLVECLISMRPETPFILTADRASLIGSEELKEKLEAKRGLIYFVHRESISEDLSRVLDRLLADKVLHQEPDDEKEYIRIRPSALSRTGKIDADVFIRLGKSRYCKLFHAGQVLEEGDLKKYVEKEGIDFFFIKREQVNEVLNKEASALEALASTNPPADQAERAISVTLENLRGMVDRLGFTPEIQRVAKASVKLTLQLVAKKPKLQAILIKLKKGQGGYITNHSLVLAQVSCALAVRLGWQSAPTMLKLSLASMLHDLALHNEDLAGYESLEDVAICKRFSASEFMDFKLHPTRAMEYARQFNEIPPDVDAIVAQHHERGDGTGFPRRLTHHQITPLASLFIVSHRLVRFYLEKGTDASLDEFFASNGEEFEKGNFRRIIKALKEDPLENVV
jgi:HD-GYP domain-containing protein (c-di-GMP phosphodiesterase class II)